jgi:hypothetical protein
MEDEPNDLHTGLAGTPAQFLTRPEMQQLRLPHSDARGLLLGLRFHLIFQCKHNLESRVSGSSARFAGPLMRLNLSREPS